MKCIYISLNIRLASSPSSRRFWRKRQPCWSLQRENIRPLKSLMEQFTKNWADPWKYHEHNSAEIEEYAKTKPSCCEPRLLSFAPIKAFTALFNCIDGSDFVRVFCSTSPTACSYLHWAPRAQCPWTKKWHVFVEGVRLILYFIARKSLELDWSSNGGHIDCDPISNAVLISNQDVIHKMSHLTEQGVRRPFNSRDAIRLFL